MGPALKWGIIGVVAWLALTRVEAYVNTRVDRESQLLIEKQSAETLASFDRARAQELEESRDTQERLAMAAEEDLRLARQEWARERQKLRLDALRSVGAAKPRTLSRLGTAATEKKFETIRSRHAEFNAGLR